jgi:hypothetical protein
LFWAVGRLSCFGLLVALDRDKTEERICERGKKVEERREIKMKRRRLKNHPMGTDTWCSHVENGRMGIPKICIRNFDCRHCAFYYWLEDFGEASASAEWSPLDFIQVQAA